MVLALTLIAAAAKIPMPPGLDFDLPGKILSQCGIVSALLLFAVGWLAWQLGKTRAAWEKDRQASVDLREADREQVLKIIDTHNRAYDALASSHAKLEGMLLALQTARR